MTVDKKLKYFLLISPFLVLALTKLGVIFCTVYFEPEISWIPSFIGYYLSIALVFLIASRYFSLSIKEVLIFAVKPLPGFGLLFGTVIIPALLPITAFIFNIKKIPVEFIIYIVIFSCINPLFEESFWRGLLNFLPGGKAFRIVYTAALFSFSHYFLWGYWFKYPMIIIPAVISTFIMGILWMWFMEKQKNLLYPVISHFFVDIFNLSVAVYCGIVTFGN